MSTRWASIVVSLQHECRKSRYWPIRRVRLSVACIRHCHSSSSWLTIHNISRPGYVVKTRDRDLYSVDTKIWSCQHDQTHRGGYYNSDAPRELNRRLSPLHHHHHIVRSSLMAAPPGGVQIGFPEITVDVRAPLIAKQCEPFRMFYQIPPGPVAIVLVFAPEPRDYLILFRIPAANVTTGYLEWICDIPAGYGFILSQFSDRFYVVQPGSTSSCLQDITATYQHAHYNTAAFRSFTALPPVTATPSFGGSAFVYPPCFNRPEAHVMSVYRLPSLQDHSQRSPSSAGYSFKSL